MRTAVAAAVLAAVAVLAPAPAHAAPQHRPGLHRGVFTLYECTLFYRVPTRDHRGCYRRPPNPYDPIAPLLRAPGPWTPR